MLYDILVVVVHMLGGVAAAALLVLGFAFLVFLGDANARGRALISAGLRQVCGDRHLPVLVRPAMVVRVQHAPPHGRLRGHDNSLPHLRRQLPSGRSNAPVSTAPCLGVVSHGVV